jgi:Raf kinase inhibitor-like YbhB/YbcL family protein
MQDGGREADMMRAALLLAATLSGTLTSMAFELSSPDVGPGKPVPKRHMYNADGCGGENISPALSWTNAPVGTKSFAMLVHDPDARSGAGFWHWLVFNIPASTASLRQGAGEWGGKSLPPGATQAENDFGDSSWGGPCPPLGSGAHNYNYTIYALGVEKLDLAKDVTAAVAAQSIMKNAIGKASMTVPVSR